VTPPVSDFYKSEIRFGRTYRCGFDRIREEFMAEISTLAYVVAKASNLDKWEHFATHILGLQTGARTAEALLLRMDEREQRLIIERGDEDDLSVLGWEFDNAADLKEYVARLREHGVDVTESAVGLAQARGMEQVYGCVDPAGIRHDVMNGSDHPIAFVEIEVKQPGALKELTLP